jgi:hypothetical protein
MKLCFGIERYRSLRKAVAIRHAQHVEALPGPCHRCNVTVQLSLFQTRWAT